MVSNVPKSFNIKGFSADRFFSGAAVAAGVVAFGVTKIWVNDTTAASAAGYLYIVSTIFAAMPVLNWFLSIIPRNYQFWRRNENSRSGQLAEAENQHNATPSGYDPPEAENEDTTSLINFGTF